MTAADVLPALEPVEDAWSDDYSLALPKSVCSCCFVTRCCFTRLKMIVYTIELFPCFPSLFSNKSVSHMVWIICSTGVFLFTVFHHSKMRWVFRCSQVMSHEALPSKDPLALLNAIHQVIISAGDGSNTTKRTSSIVLIDFRCLLFSMSYKLKYVCFCSCFCMFISMLLEP